MREVSVAESREWGKHDAMRKCDIANTNGLEELRGGHDEGLGKVEVRALPSMPLSFKASPAAVKKTCRCGLFMVIRWLSKHCDLEDLA